MNGLSQFSLSAVLTAFALLSTTAVQAHTGNQMYDTLESLTGHSPERLEPRMTHVRLSFDLPPPDATEFIIRKSIHQVTYTLAQ